MQIAEHIYENSYDTGNEIDTNRWNTRTKREQIERTIAYFFTYSLIGWIWETIYTAIDTGTLQKRGFLHLPILPIYGVALVLIVSLFSDKGYSLQKIFFGSACITSIQEFVTSWVLEKVFHQVWWDYSQMNVQIQGRVCLLGAMAFGTASVIIVRLVHPKIERKVEQFFLQPYSRKLCVFGLLLVVVDTCITSFGLLK